jgi:hypothetical protein
MANPEHLAKLKEGAQAWNQWRKANPGVVPDLQRAFLQDASLSNADLKYANLNGADLDRAVLTDADLCGANLEWADLHSANLEGADLSGANLNYTTLVRTNFQRATLTDCSVFGISIWNIQLAGAIQSNLVITPTDESVIQVDSLELAQLVYLLLNNSKIQQVIDTITSKAVLILGRFTPKRKTTLNALRDAVRSKNYVPIVFDFEKPANRDYTETVSTLAHLARFVIADLTDPRSIPQELTAIIPRLLSVPVRALLLGSQREWGMFSDLARYPQVIKPPFYYTGDEMLLRCLDSDVIGPAERKTQEMAGIRFQLNGTGSSTNVVPVSEDAVFPLLRREILAKVSDTAKRLQVIEVLDALEQSKGTTNYPAKFRDFIAVTADLMTTVGSFIQPLTALIK